MPDPTERGITLLVAGLRTLLHQRGMVTESGALFRVETAVLPVDFTAIWAQALVLVGFSAEQVEAALRRAAQELAVRDLPQPANRR